MSVKFSSLEVLDCPYLPPEFIAMRDSSGISVLNTKTGYVIRLPPISIKTELRADFLTAKDGVVGYLDVTLKFGRRF